MNISALRSATQRIMRRTTTAISLALRDMRDFTADPAVA
jgi:hypothetical protein